MNPSGDRSIILAVALGIAVAPINGTMIIVALPEIMREMRVDASQAGWLVTAYLIALAAGAPIAGKIGDRLGRRAPFLAGMALFALGSLASTFAGSFWLLLLLRVVQAVGGVVAWSNGSAVIREVITPGSRATAMGFIAMVVSLAAAVGPAVGGILAGYGWRLIFLASVPVCFVAVLLAARSFPAAPARGDAARFDLPGAVVLGLILACGAWTLIQGSRVLEAPVLLLVWVVLAGAVAAFLRAERRHPDAILDPRLFKHRPFAAANIAGATTSLAWYAIFLSLPLLEGALRGSRQAGFELMAFTVPVLLLAPVGGRLADRFGRRFPPSIGFAMLALGALHLALTAGAGGPLRVLALVVAGSGQGLANAGLETAALESLPRHLAGTASGVFSASRNFGSIVGSSLVASLVVAGQRETFTPVFWAVVGAAVISTAAALSLHTYPPAETQGAQQ
ncbi:MAG TPA: MFS transporter [Deinococcales bacterium]|nr:MFS transporter [Deinococcales bacterium]